MARCIDADALIEHIKDVPTWWMNEQVGFLARKYPDGLYDPNDVISSIENAPTIEARPVVRGEWENHGMYMICPVCGAEFDDDIVNMCRDGGKSAVNFCGHCGADMRGDGDG